MKDETLKAIKNYLKGRELEEVTLVFLDGAKARMDLLDDKLITITKNRELIYKLNPVFEEKKIGVNYCKIGQRLFEITDIITAGTKILAEITRKPTPSRDVYVIYIDGEERDRTTSSMRCTKQVRTYLRERKDGNISFKHLKVVAPNGDRTDYIF